MKKRIGGFIVVILLIVSVTGCNTVMRAAGQLLDGTVTASKTIAVYEAVEGSVAVKQEHPKDGADFLSVSIGTVPNLTFKTSMPDASGRLYLTSYTFLCSSISGWNEFVMDVSASGIFAAEGNTASLSITNPIEVIGISSGKIRYNDQRSVDDTALRSLKNRYERIFALVEWMKAQSNVPALGSEKEFQSYWKPLILPEMVAKKKRPASWTEEQAEWNRAEDIKWNVSYTEQVFPEELYEYRNSGGLLRDFEEALSWMYLEYNWDAVCAKLYTAIQLIKE
ncbi:MAG: hypothetical protein LBU99_00650 [Spirochaetaceae bacterium]|jgi:predicted small secreted protein|nr:hypothetical protein [Spirochaetaceae bacterium]